MTQEPGYTFPNSVVTRTYQGNRAYAVQFDGDGNNLLYQLKNFMSFRGLMQSRMTRFSTDGTIIIVSSIVSSITKIATDFIDIDVRKSVFITGVGIPSCAITFLNLPTVVQPMKYPGEIHDGEIEGVDYLKIYYTLDIKNCPECTDEVWNLCDHNIPDCDQFKFMLGGIPSIDEDPTNHCIESPATCHAQLISHGVDEYGGYLVFKVFTEWSFADPSSMVYSRNGLGYMLLHGKIEDSAGRIICEIQDTIKVDCCEKDSEHRKVILWDESDYFGGDREMIFDASGVFYKTPATVTLAGLTAYTLGSGAFWVLPDLFGGCLPFTWSLTGPGILLPNKSGSASYQTPVDGFNCNDSVTIKVKDRCGTEDLFTTTPCCPDASPLIIGYTSLVMGCGGQQTFTAAGGCAPYSWEVISGGGSIDPTSPGSDTAIYTSPDTNPNCTSNPTIQVTDCCGETAQIQLAVNCYTTPVGILQYCNIERLSVCKCLECYNLHCYHMSTTVNYGSTYWNCNGDVHGVPCEVVAGGYDTYSIVWAPPCIASPNCYQPSMPKDCTYGEACDDWINGQTDCNFLPFCGDCYGRMCNTLYDLRTSDQKTGGCCPLNPLTGLPY